MTERVKKSEEEWRETLSEEEYEILRKKGTERAFTGRYWDEKMPGSIGAERVARPSSHPTRSTIPGAVGRRSSSLWEVPSGETGRTGAISWCAPRSMCANCRVTSDTCSPMVRSPRGTAICINSASLTLEPEEDQS